MIPERTSEWTVGTLIEALRGLDPNTPVYICGFHARGMSRITLTTMGDPVTGRYSGDPEGPSCVVIE
jgi:hypothetical protein